RGVLGARASRPPFRGRSARRHSVRPRRDVGEIHVIVIPAIDVRGGHAVRLLRGDPDTQTTYGDDPVELAIRFQDEGARRLHVVDLDAALGTGSNTELVEAICRSVAVPVQLGGGIRS